MEKGARISPTTSELSGIDEVMPDPAVEPSSVSPGVGGPAGSRCAVREVAREDERAERPGRDLVIAVVRFLPCLSRLKPPLKLASFVRVASRKVPSRRAGAFGILEGYTV